MNEIRELINQKRKDQVRRRSQKTKGIVVDSTQLPDQMFNIEYPDTRNDN